MENFGQKDTANDNNKEAKKDPWLNAIEVWNEIFLNDPIFKPYDIEKDAWQPYLTKHYVTEDGKLGVWARLYQDNDPSEFVLVSNGGDPMALLEVASKLLEKKYKCYSYQRGL